MADRVGFSRVIDEEMRPDIISADGRQSHATFNELKAVLKMIDD